MAEQRTPTISPSTVQTPVIPTAKPITELPTTLGKALDQRNRVENRVRNLQEKYQKTNPFWECGKEPVPAEETVQQILDRHQVLFELNEILGAVAVLKMSDVVVPSLLGLQSYNLTLSQLRDSETYLKPYLEQILDTVMAQMNTVARACDQHNSNIESALKSELAELERQFKCKCETAKQYLEVPPTSESLENDKSTSIRRADTKKAVKVDSIGVSQFVTTLKPFITLLNEKRNDKIDACNAEDSKKEIEMFYQKRNEANEHIRAGTNIAYDKQLETDCLDQDEHVSDKMLLNLSMADLTSAMTDLGQLISASIPTIRVVSFRKGQDAKLENPDVEFGKERLGNILMNIHILMQYRQKHREMMSLQFTSLHPLTKSPCSLDAMVRLGYVTKSIGDSGLTQQQKHMQPKRQRPGNNQNRVEKKVHVEMENMWIAEKESEKGHISLCQSLTQLEKHLNCAEQNMKIERDQHELKISQSISEKQEARTKNGAAVKGTELDEIARAVRTADEKKWYLANNLASAKERIENLLENVSSLQSADRKAANATLRVTVSKHIEMPWVNKSTDLDDWGGFGQFD